MALDDQTQTVPTPGKKASKPSKKEDKIVINPKLDDPQSMSEEKESTAVMAFGRFNPPTVGHEKLIKKVADVAKEHNGSAHVIASHSQGTSKDPLPQDKKIGYLKKVAPEGVSVSGSSKEAPHFLAAAKKLHDAGHKHLVMVAGSDRVDEYKQKLNQYNGKEGSYNFKSIKVVSSGERDPDAEGVEGMSGTKMRALARSGKHDEFKAGLPKALHPHAGEIAGHIKSVAEAYAYIWEIDLDEAGVPSYMTRYKRSLTMRKLQPRLRQARAMARLRYSTPNQLKRKAQRAAKALLVKRYSGDSGVRYQNLPAVEKARLDKQIAARVNLMKMLVKRVNPFIKQHDNQRVISQRTSDKIPTRTLPLMMSNTNDLFREKFIQESNKAADSLINKSEKSNIPLDIIFKVFERGLNEEVEGKTPQQVAFERVNSFINGGAASRLDEDLIPENLRKWFQDKWVRMDTKGNIKGPCAREEGEGKPKCLPLAKARAMDKEDRATAVRRKRREDPNPERSGPAINVATEEKDACYHKVKARYKVWPSAYASGALSKCRKAGADNWGNAAEETQLDEISAKTKLSYVAKAAASTNEPKEGESQSDYLERLHKRMSGIKKALSSTNPSQRFQKEESELNELSQQVKTEYLKKASNDFIKQLYNDPNKAKKRATALAKVRRTVEEVDIPDQTTQKLKKITKQLDKSSLVHHNQSVALKKLISKDTKDVEEEKNCGCGKIPCVTYGPKIENFMDNKNPEDKGDMARHGLKGKTISQLKAVRSSETATPRAKQLAHWYINMHKGKK